LATEARQANGWEPKLTYCHAIKNFIKGHKSFQRGDWREHLIPDWIPKWFTERTDRPRRHRLRETGPSRQIMGSTLGSKLKGRQWT
jgi:hypothetical protein